MAGDKEPERLGSQALLLALLLVALFILIFWQ